MMKKLLVALGLIFTLSAIVGWGNVVGACPYDDPADPRNAACAPATEVVNVSTSVEPTSTVTVAPSSTTPVSPPTSLVPEGDVPGRSRVCPEGQFPQTYEPFAPCGPDRCIDTDGDGIGTTMWHLDWCRTGAVSGVDQQLPATGSPLVRVLVVVAFVLFVGGLCLSALHYVFVVRPRRRRG